MLAIERNSPEHSFDEQGVSFSLFAASFVLPASGNAVAQTDFKVCESTYALCTSAPCTTVSAKDGTVSCACEVEDRLFRRAGALPGEGDQRGQELRSRYFPLKNVAVCTNDRPRGLVPRQAMPGRQERSDKGHLRLHGGQGPGSARHRCGSLHRQAPHHWPHFISHRSADHSGD